MAIRITSFMPKQGPHFPRGPRLQLAVFFFVVALAVGVWLLMVLGKTAKPDEADLQTFEQLPPRLDVGILERPPFSTDFQQFGQRPTPTKGGRANPFQP